MDYLTSDLYIIALGIFFYVPVTYILYRRIVRRTQLRKFAGAVLSIMRSRASRGTAIDDSIVRVEMFVASNDSSWAHGSTIDLMERVFSAIHSGEKTTTLHEWKEEDERLFDSILMAMKARHPFASLSGEFQSLLSTLKEEVGSRESISLVVDQVGEKVKSVEAELRRQKTQTLIATVVSLAGVAFSVVGLFQ